MRSRPAVVGGAIHTHMHTKLTVPTDISLSLVVHLVFTIEFYLLKLLPKFLSVFLFLLFPVSLKSKDDDLVIQTPTTVDG